MSFYKSIDSRVLPSSCMACPVLLDLYNCLVLDLEYCIAASQVLDYVANQVALLITCLFESGEWVGDCASDSV